MPQSTTGTAPAELLIGRRVRTHFDLVNQNRIYLNIVERAHNFGSGNKWLSGKIISKEERNVVNIEWNDGRIWRRHIDYVIVSKTQKEKMEALVAHKVKRV